MKKLLILFIFLLLFMLAACGDVSDGGNSLSSAEQGDTDINQAGNEEQADNAEMNDGSSITTTFTVSGMTCQRCVAAIDSELSALSGVISVSLNLRSGALIVEHEPSVSIEELMDIVILEGFRIE